MWVELMHLVIPTLNDDEKMLRRMCGWILANVGKETPLHLSAFAPRYKLRNLPPTPAATLVRMREVARAEGLAFGYPGCCVESFLSRGYARNGLRPRDQRMLFHWACPGCSVSPRLAQSYREVHAACRHARGSYISGLRVGPCACVAPRRLAEFASWAALLVARPIATPTSATTAAAPRRRPRETAGWASPRA